MDASNAGFSKHYPVLLGIALGMQPKRVLEFGCGLSSIVLAEALSKTGGTLTTLDMRSIEETGNTPNDVAHYAGTWTYIVGDSRETVAKLPNEGFDLVLHDGSHEWRTVLADLRAILPKIKRDGILLTHDTLHPQLGRGMRLAVRLALLFVRHERTTLPYGYGLTIIRIKRKSRLGAYKDTWRKIKE